MYVVCYVLYSLGCVKDLLKYFIWCYRFEIIVYDLLLRVFRFNIRCIIEFFIVCLFIL